MFVVENSANKEARKDWAKGSIQSCGGKNHMWVIGQRKTEEINGCGQRSMQVVQNNRRMKSDG